MTPNPLERPAWWVGLLVFEDSRRVSTPQGRREVLQEGTFVLVDLSRMLEIIEGASPGKVVDALEDRGSEYILGILTVVEAEPNRYDCGRVLEVLSSVAKRGWGPWLYDAALDYADQVDLEGVLPDRSMVSASAERIWRAYDQRRPDVTRRSIGDRNCPLYDVDVLDSVYSARAGFPRDELRKMRRRFRAALVDATELAPVSANEIEEAVLSAGDDFYEARMGRGGAMLRPVTAGPRRDLPFRRVLNLRRRVL